MKAIPYKSKTARCLKSWCAVTAEFSVALTKSTTHNMDRNIRIFLQRLFQPYPVQHFLQGLWDFWKYHPHNLRKTLIIYTMQYSPKLVGYQDQGSPVSQFAPLHCVQQGTPFASQPSARHQCLTTTSWMTVHPWQKVQETALLNQWR